MYMYPSTVNSILVCGLGFLVMGIDIEHFILASSKWDSFFEVPAFCFYMAIDKIPPSALLAVYNVTLYYILQH